MLTSVVRHIEVCTCVLIFDAIFVPFGKQTPWYLCERLTHFMDTGSLYSEIWGKLALFSNSNCAVSERGGQH